MAVGFFDQFLGDIGDVSKVTPDELRRFIVALQVKPKWAGRPQSNSQKLSSTTLNTYTRTIKAFWSWLKCEGIIKENPLADVPAPKLPKRLPKTLTEDELIKVLKATGNGRDRAIIEVLLDTGMRLGELCGLNRDDTDTMTSSIKVFGKGSKERMVFVTPETALAIQIYCSICPRSPQGRVGLTELHR